MRTFRIPAALLVAASLALFGCGNLATGPDVEAVDMAPQFSAGASARPLVESVTRNFTVAACTGELVDVVVRIQGVFARVDHEGGVAVFLDNITLHGSGVGRTTGDKYRLTEWSHMFVVPAVGDGVAVTLTETRRTTLIHAGRGDNKLTLVSLTDRITINANGDITVRVDSFTSECP